MNSFQIRGPDGRLHEFAGAVPRVGAAIRLGAAAGHVIDVRWRLFPGAPAVVEVGASWTRWTVPGPEPELDIATHAIFVPGRDDQGEEDGDTAERAARRAHEVEIAVIGALAVDAAPVQRGPDPVVVVPADVADALDARGGVRAEEVALALRAWLADPTTAPRARARLDELHALCRRRLEMAAPGAESVGVGALDDRIVALADELRAEGGGVAEAAEYEWRALQRRLRPTDPAPV